jgi:hypothetical protein
MQYHLLWILIAVIIIIFIRGTFPIQEGARNKGGKKKSEPAPASAPAPAPAPAPATESKPKKKHNKKKPFNLVKTAQNAMLKPQLKSIEKSQNKIEKTQKLVDAKLNDLSKQQETIKQYYNDLSSNITKQKDDVSKYYTDLSSNMFNQYTMYKTSIETVAKQAVSDISGAGVAAQNYANGAAASANDAKTYANNALSSANKAEQVYKDVFGKSSASIIQNNNNSISGNVIVDLSGNTTTEPFTGFKEGLSSIYTTQVSGNKYIYDLETDVIAALNDFNTAYYAYMKCQSGTRTCSVTKTHVENKETELRKKIAELKAAYQTESNDISGSAFNTQHNSTIRSSDRVASMRADLDAKMANIMTPMHEITRDYDASVYTGIALSILAASLAYYLVVE